MGVKDSITAFGFDKTLPKLNEDFTIEMIVKPAEQQISNAIVLNNIGNSDTGFSFQLNGDSQNHYVLLICYGTSKVTRVFFQLENNVWNYMAFVVNKKIIKAYDNGKLLSAIDTGVLPYVNSDLPITLGNNFTRQFKFAGYIREVKIDNGNINEDTITHRGFKINEQLNSISHGSGTFFKIIAAKYYSHFSLARIFSLFLPTDAGKI